MRVKPLREDVFEWGRENILNSAYEIDKPEAIS